MEKSTIMYITFLLVVVLTVTISIFNFKSKETLNVPNEVKISSTKVPSSTSEYPSPEMVEMVKKLKKGNKYIIGGHEVDEEFIDSWIKGEPIPLWGLFKHTKPVLVFLHKGSFTEAIFLSWSDPDRWPYKSNPSLISISPPKLAIDFKLEPEKPPIKHEVCLSEKPKPDANKINVKKKEEEQKKKFIIFGILLEELRRHGFQIR